MDQNKVNIKQLMGLSPFDRFSEKQMVLVAANSTLKYFEPGQIVLKVGNHDKLEYFLLEGSVELESFDGRFKEIQAGSESARTAIALLQPRKYTIRTKTACLFVLIKQAAVNALLEELPVDRTVGFNVSDLHSGHEIQDIKRNFEADLKTNNLTLPSFPEVAIRIKHLLDEPDVSVKDIADVLNNDPAMTVKLLKTCNSALYRTAAEVTSNRDAIVRLGFDTTRQLITIFALKELFQSKNKLLQQKIQELWLHSREVASIAYVLAKITPGMNPEEAMLAGLIQNIGVIPVLNYIGCYPDFMKLDYKVDEITDSLKSDIGAQVLDSWGFAPELVDVARHCENWLYKSPGDKATYTDITVVANIHSYLGKNKHPVFPPFDQIPSFRKLGESGLTPKESQEVLHQSRQQLNDLQALLSPHKL